MRSTCEKRGVLPSHADSGSGGAAARASAADCSTRQAACDGLPIPHCAIQIIDAATTSSKLTNSGKEQRRWRRHESSQDLRSSAGTSAPAGASSRSGRGLRGVDKGESGSTSAKCLPMRGLHAAVVRSGSVQRRHRRARKRHTLSRKAAAPPPGRATACGGARFVAKLRQGACSRQRAPAYRPSATRASTNAVSAAAHEPQGTARGAARGDAQRTARGASTEPPSTSMASMQRRAARLQQHADRHVERSGVSGHTSSERGRVALPSASHAFTVCLHSAPQLSLLPPPQRSRNRREAGIIARGGDVGRDARFCSKADVRRHRNVVSRRGFAAHDHTVAEGGRTAERNVSAKQAAAACGAQSSGKCIFERSRRHVAHL